MKNNQGRATQEAQETFVDIRYLVVSCFVGEQGNPRTLLIFPVEQGRATQAAQDSFVHIRYSVVFLFRRGGRKSKTRLIITISYVNNFVAIVAQANAIQARHS